MWPTFKETLSWICCLKICVIFRIIVVAGTYSTLFPSNWNKCSTIEPFYKARVGLFQQCILECQYRKICEGVNFYRRSGLCELLDTMDTMNLTLNISHQPCVSMSRAEMSEIPSCSCEENEICNLTTATCEIKECPKLGPLQKGTIHGNRQSVSSVVKVVCDLFYRLEPNNGRIVCQSDGSWNPNTSCVPDIVCSALPSVSNATIVIDGDMTPGTVVTYTCDVGTVLTPSDTTLLTVVCQNDTSWSQNIAFQCIEVCDTPPSVDNSLSTANGDLIPGATLKYSCDVGYTAHPNDVSLLTIQCQTNKTWSSVGFECILDCPNPPAEAFATLNAGGTSVNTVRTYTCNNLYITATGSTTLSVTCQSTGVWTSPTETCLRDCSSPPSITAGSISPGTTYDGSVRQYTCDSGYTIQVDGTMTQDTTTNVTCQSDGRWSATIQCIPDCTDPPGKLFATLNAGDVCAGSVRTYTCNNLYITATGTTTLSITCQNTGEWTSPTETCLRDCSNPPAIPNGSVSAGSTYEGSVRQYTCDPGYTIQINSAKIQDISGNVTCQSNGQWSAIIHCDLGCVTESDLVNALSDSEIWATSFWNNNYQAFYGRLDNTKAWGVGTEDENQYIQFNFIGTKVVTGITTQGFDGERVTQYLVKYSVDCSTFLTVTNSAGQTQQFTGNSDDDGHVSHTFSSPVQARCIQVNPKAWHSWIAMRVALIGC